MRTEFGPEPVVGGGERVIGAMPVRRGTGTFRLAWVAVIVILVAAWGGIVSFVGPVFGYSADGTASWTWNLAHAVLGLVPGAVGVFAGLMMLAAAMRSERTARPIAAATGLLALLAGAWFVIGPWAWPVLVSTTPYFAMASAPNLLANVVGYSLGPGLVLALCGGLAMGWALPNPSVVPGSGVQPMPRGAGEPGGSRVVA